MKDIWIGQVGIWGCGSPVETSAEGRSTVRAGRRDQRHYRYLKENKSTVVNVMRMNGNLKAYLREVDEQAEEMLFHLVKQMAKNEGMDEAMKRLSPQRRIIPHLHGGVEGVHIHMYNDLLQAFSSNQYRFYYLAIRLGNTSRMAPAPE